MFIKGIGYNLNELINDKTLVNYYQNPVIIVLRLNIDDYHRFHFPLSCYYERLIKKPGYYYSVYPTTLKKRINNFCKNKRNISVLNHKKKFKFLMIEVGSTLVGSIKQTALTNNYYKKGDEKGYFCFGGSTIILIFNSEFIDINQDILKDTNKGIEKKILMGDQLATLKGA